MTKYRGFAPSTGAFVVVPEENEKSEPFSNRKQVRIFLVWWSPRDGTRTPKIIVLRDYVVLRIAV